MRLRSIILRSGLLLLVASSAGCVTFQWSPLPTTEAVALSPRRTWVPIGADSSLILLGARVVGDTLTGLIEGSAPPGRPLARYSAPVASVPKIATEHLNVGYALRFASAMGAILLTVAIGQGIQGAGQ